MKETPSHQNENETKTKRTYFYEHQYYTTSLLHCIPKRLCHTTQEVDTFVRNHHTTSFVARHKDGSVLHTGTHEQMRRWVVKQSQPVWVEPCLLSSHVYQELCGLRLVYTTDDTPVLYRRTLQHAHNASTQPVLSFPYITQSIVVATDGAHQTYKEACLFLRRNRAQLPASGYIDMCNIDKDTGCYYITDVQDVDNG